MGRRGSRPYPLQVSGRLDCEKAIVACSNRNARAKIAAGVKDVGGDPRPCGQWGGDAVGREHIIGCPRQTARAIHNKVRAGDSLCRYLRRQPGPGHADYSGAIERAGVPGQARPEGRELKKIN
jgi:hypothetical protein